VHPYDPHGYGPIVLILLGIAAILACAVEAMEKVIAGRRQKQREREWSDLKNLN
jgi:hypothetical protein